MYGRRNKSRYGRRRRSKTAFFNSLLKTRRYARRRTKAPLVGKRRGYFRKTGFFGKFRGEDAENKFHDVLLTNFQAEATGNLEDSLITISQGTGESQRIGRKINIVSMQLKYSWSLAVAPSSSASNSVRAIVFVDKQTNGTAISIDDVIASATVAGIHGHYNLANEDRFDILWDKTWDLNRKASANTGAGSAGVSKIGEYRTTMDIPIEYSGTNGTITELRTNNIGLICFKVFAVDIAGLTAHFRFRYQDA